MSGEQDLQTQLNHQRWLYGFGDYCHDAECLFLSSRLEVIENELKEMIGANKLQNTPEMTLNLQ